jgi:translation initiation factor IF-2
VILNDTVIEKATKPKRKAAAEKASPALPQVEIPSSIIVKQLAEVLKIEPVKAIKQLMRRGIMVSINQAIDFDTAAIIAADLGYIAQPKQERKVVTSVSERTGAKLKPRPPVVTVMGHVDHGKTTLLDAIRKTNVIAQEAGAITQHIGAYQTVVNGNKITFLDTPGHEAFTAMRARGAQATDIVVLVVAADDGIMPQTLEAIDHAKAAKVQIVVAINKIDKANATPDRIKQQLADVGLIIEEWGGEIVCVPISAKQGTGISDLLENLFLVADILELKADYDGTARGVVIEAKLDKSKGALATVLVQNGTLRQGNIVVAGNVWGKVKAMFNDKGKPVNKAGPSTPIEVLGINGVPRAGDSFSVATSEHQARNIAIKQQNQFPDAMSSLSAISSQINKGKLKELNIVLRTDVIGSIEPIKKSIEQLSTEKVKVNVIHAASGSITENDILLASASKGIVIGFNANTAPGAQRLAEVEKVAIRHYDIIYRLEEDVGSAVKGMLEPTYTDVFEGRAEVRAVFDLGKQKKIAGAYIKEGKARRNSKVKLIRQNKLVVESRISSLKRFKEVVNEVLAGFECGIGIDNFYDLQVGDSIEFYKEERVS